MLERSCFLNAALLLPQTKFEHSRETSKRNGKMIRSLAIAASSALFGVWLLPYDFQLKIRFLKWLTKSPRMSYPFFFSKILFRSPVDFYVNVNRDSYSSSMVEFVVANCVGFVDWRFDESELV